MDAAARRTLEQRARELARVPAAPASAERLELLAFRVAGEQFGLETTALVEVFRAGAIARLPESDAPFLGVTVWRGQLLELLDPRALLGLPMSAEDQLTHVIVLRAERAPFGVLVGLEREIASLPRADVHEPDERRTYVRAVTRTGMQILDPAALLRL